MNAVFLAFERASVLGLAALAAALVAQFWLDSRVPASWRVWIWRAALLQTALALVPLAPLRLAVLPPRPPVVMPLQDERNTMPPRPQLEERPQTLLLPAKRSSPTPNTFIASPRVAARPKSATLRPRVSARVETIRPHSPWSPWPFVLGFYALGLGFQLVALARSFRRVRQILRACSPIENDAIRVQLGEIARRMRGSNLPRLLQSESGAPFLTGVFRPVMVLPRALLSPQNDALEAVLCHELAHLKRRDLAWNALLWLIQTAFWFHPLAWAARRFLALETESACDEMVLGSTRITPKSYGALLINAMKNEQTPLTAGVADGFFALKTRLLRLNRTPKRPHRAFRLAFVAALCLAFGALVPLRFVARAQSEAPPTQTPNLISGTVSDKDGKPVAGATVYAMRSMHNGREPLETTVSDANGAFQFSPKVRDKWAISVFVDAGQRGMGEGFVFLQGGRKARPARVRIAPLVRAQLRFLDPQGRPAPNLTVRLWRVGESQNQWMAMPRSVLARMKAITDARGEAVFPPLPAGKLAQFQLGDEKSLASGSGLGDRRGGRFAPLSIEDFVRLNAPETSKTIHLLSPVRVVGRAVLGEGDGRAASEAYIWARRITPTEDRGEKGSAIDRLIAGGRTDARGNYSMEGLRPGSYWVWIGEGQWARNWVGPSLRRSLTKPVNRVDFVLLRGAIIQGVVLAQGTGEPVKGQTMGLSDEQDNRQYAITDARGYFRFRALGGKQHLWVHANGSNSPPPGFILPAKSEFDFSIKNGEKRDFRIEMPVVKPMTGTVLGPDGKAVANALVSVEGLGGMRDFETRGGVRSDENGRFSIAAKLVSHPARLFAQTPDAATPHGTVVQSGDEVTLRLENDVLAGFDGQILDKKTQKPLEGVSVHLRVHSGGGIAPVATTRTGANGKFTFRNLRPFRAYYVQAVGDGYQENATPLVPLRRGQTARPTIFMQRLSASLSGRVVRADGTPARGFRVLGASKNTLTQNDGTFIMPRVVDEKVQLYVRAPNNGALWGPLWTRGGRTGVVFRLTDALRNGLGTADRTSWQQFQSERKNLVGRVAPPLRVSGWVGRPISLRGQVTLLNFQSLFPGSDVLNDFARSFASRGVQVVGVQSPSRIAGRRTKSLAYLQRFRQAGDIVYPFALDAPHQKPSERVWPTGQSAAFYQGAQFVVVGHDGKIAFVGDDSADAMRAALALRK